MRGGGEGGNTGCGSGRKGHGWGGGGFPACENIKRGREKKGIFGVTGVGFLGAGFLAFFFFFNVTFDEKHVF